MASGKKVTLSIKDDKFPSINLCEFLYPGSVKDFLQQFDNAPQSSPKKARKHRERPDES